MSGPLVGRLAPWFAHIRVLTLLKSPMFDVRDNAGGRSMRLLAFGLAIPWA